MSFTPQPNGPECHQGARNGVNPGEGSLALQDQPDRYGALEWDNISVVLGRSINSWREAPIIEGGTEATDGRGYVGRARSTNDFNTTRIADVQGWGWNRERNKAQEGKRPTGSTEESKAGASSDRTRQGRTRWGKCDATRRSELGTGHDAGRRCE